MLRKALRSLLSRWTEAAVRSDASYIGLIGSKRKSLLIFEELFRQGIPEERIREIRAPVGLDIGGRTPDEIALIRNTTEGNSVAVHALDLKRGDEVLLWDQNHPTNNIAWRVRAARDGFAVRTVSLRWPPESTEEILEAFGKSDEAHEGREAFAEKRPPNFERFRDS